MDTATALSTTEQGDFVKLKEEFKSIQKETSRGLLILMEIRDRRLWRVDYESFEAFCQLEFGTSRRHANRLIEGAVAVAEVVGGFDAAKAAPGHNVSQTGPDATENAGGKPQAYHQWVGQQQAARPANAKQAEALAKAPEGERAAVWKEAVDTAPKGKVTAKHVEKVVARRATTKPVDDGCPKSDPECLGDNGDCHDACEQQPETTPPPLDRLGHPIADPQIVAAFAEIPTIKGFMRAASSLKAEFKKIAEGPAGAWATRRLQAVSNLLSSIHSEGRFSLPHAICPYCGGQRCDACKQTGWMPEEVYKAVPEDVKGGGDAV